MFRVTEKLFLMDKSKRYQTDQEDPRSNYIHSNSDNDAFLTVANNIDNWIHQIEKTIAKKQLHINTLPDHLQSRPYGPNTANSYGSRSLTRQDYGGLSSGGLVCSHYFLSHELSEFLTCFM